MNVLTRVGLVALRLAIGWHIFFEGLDKVQSHFRGPVEGAPVWTSAPYLRESTGPLAPLFRSQVGEDPNDYALARLVVAPTEPGARPKLPEALEKDWQDYFDRFVAHYKVGDSKMLQPEMLRVLCVVPSAGLPGAVPWHVLDQLNKIQQPDKVQLELARAALDQAKDEALTWLLRGDREVERSFSRVKENVKETTPERIREYREKLFLLREIEERGLWRFGKDVWKKKLPTLKEEIAQRRAELLAELNQPMKEAMEFTFAKRLTAAQRARGPIPEEPPARGLLWWTDRITMWGLTVVGACLLLGLFSRTACVGGALLLLMFYAAMPALPWLPISPRAEGHYFFVNKNLIEMLALLTLATTHSGRWVGLDGLIHALIPQSLREKPRGGISDGSASSPRAAARGLEPTATRQPLASPSPPSPVKEAPHGP
ncbi:MAG: hypothetical protein L0Z62_33255 [Gemmataceae bacterium]|nr:hypothetical protein [Gemmataceae bacterium]